MFPGSRVVGECAAPHTSLYFDPTGNVTACCANATYVLGRISPHAESNSIREMWEGQALRAQRVALDSKDFSRGCHECGAGVAAGNRSSILAREFDRYRADGNLDFPRFMDFALSNSCNLRCVMCNGDLSSAIRGRREHREPLPTAYGEDFFEELTEFLPHLHEASFKGGEPFLSRETRRVWDDMLRLGVRPRTTVTTNGTQWDSRVAEYVSGLAMNVIVSVDGASAETVESIRLGAVYDEIVENIGRFRVAADAAGGSLTLNYCLMPQNWHELGAFLADADERGLPVHVIPVGSPAAFDLQRLPTGEIRRVIASLRDEDRVRSRQLGRNLGVWAEQVDRLERHVDGRTRPAVGQGVDSPIRRRARRAQLDERIGDLSDLGPSDLSLSDVGDVREMIADLVAWSGRAVITLEVEDGVIRAVEAPRWSVELLGADQWLGTRTERLVSLICGRTGLLEARLELIDRGRDVVEAKLRIGPADRTMKVRALVVPRTAGETERQVVLLAMPARAVE